MADEADAFRAKAAELTQRLRDDIEFRKQAREDPIGVLTAAGLPVKEARLRQGESDASVDVSGYRMKNIEDISIEVVDANTNPAWLC